MRTTPTIATTRSFVKKVSVSTPHVYQALFLNLPPSISFRLEKSVQLVFVGPLIVKELKRIVETSEIVKEDDSNWPKPNIVGKQELEVRLGTDHISFHTAKIGSLMDVSESEDPEGLRVFYYLVQDVKCLVFSLISLHFKIKPI
ncbi:hypothetical protein FRC20_000737 [Serendipita sp. 405]|nr:hypothetical protein FRC20_000737 [Serendipita sp. 405]